MVARLCQSLIVTLNYASIAVYAKQYIPILYLWIYSEQTSCIALYILPQQYKL